MTISLVTGANRGLGKEVARQLAEKGHTVLLTARNFNQAQATAKELAIDGLIPAQLDVTDNDSMSALVQRVESEFAVLDVLINNAAIHYDTWQNVVNADLSVVQEAMDTNFYGAWKMVQAFLPLMKKSQHPRIVNVSSGGGAYENFNGVRPAYSMSKLALNGLTVMLANKLRSDRFLVNAVCPGWTATDMGGSGGRPVADGAAGITWAATLPDDAPTGGFFRDMKPIDW